MDRKSSFQKLNEMIKGIDFAMLTTLDDQGLLRSRPMSTQQIDDEGNVWLFASDDSPKSIEIEQDQRVNLSYSDPKSQRYVSLSGRAQISHNRTKIEELWNPVLKAWFPKGLEDPHLCLIKVDAEQAEFWDSPSSKMVQLFGFLKAVITGEKAKGLGENQKISMH